MEQREFQQYFPRAGWVQHDAEEIWQSQHQDGDADLLEAKLAAGDIAAIGITNQRETTVLWERAPGKPVAPGLSKSYSASSRSMQVTICAWQRSINSGMSSSVMPAVLMGGNARITSLPLCHRFSRMLRL